MANGGATIVGNCPGQGKCTLICGFFAVFVGREIFPDQSEFVADSNFVSFV
jgi:hypothetical protein